MAPPAGQAKIGRMATADHLDVPVREVMTAGVMCLAESASLRQVQRAMATHRTHAVLIVGQADGRPLGWVTTRGLLAFADCDHALVNARSAITEEPTALEPAATAREALKVLLTPGVSHVLVSRRPGTPPEGVLSDADLARVITRGSS